MVPGLALLLHNILRDCHPKAWDNSKDFFRKVSEILFLSSKARETFESSDFGYYSTLRVKWHLTSGFFNTCHPSRVLALKSCGLGSSAMATNRQASFLYIVFSFLTVLGGKVGLHYLESITEIEVFSKLLIAHSQRSSHWLS